MGRSLVVKLTAGADEPERCAQAFNVAGAAVAAGVPVSMWLTGDAVLFALPGQAEQFELAHSAPLDELRDLILEGGSLTVCTQCAIRREVTQDRLIPGVKLAGAATFVAQIMEPAAQALVY